MDRADKLERAGSLEAVRAALADPHNAAVYIVGPAGSGKSFLLDQLTTGATDPLAAREAQVPRSDPAVRPSLPIRPSNGTGDLTLAALLPVLYEPPREPAPLPSRAARQEPRMLAIDDIDQLDGSSLVLLGQAMDRHRIRLVATMRTSAAPQVLETLRTVGESCVVTLTAWRARDIEEFVARRLGGRMHGLTLARLLEFTGGNPLCVIELVDVGSATGSLRREHGIWFSDDELTVPPVTAARIGSDLPRLAPEARDVLDTTALVGPTHLDALEKAFGTAAIEEADESGALSIEQRNGHLQVAVRSTIEARVIAQRLSTTRRRRLRASFLSRQDPHEEAGAAGGPPEGIGGPAAHLARTLLVAGPRVALDLAGTIGDGLADDQQILVQAVTGWCHLSAGALVDAQACAERLRHRGVADDCPRAYQLGALLAGRCALAAGDAARAQMYLGETAVLREDPECAATAEWALAPLALAHAMAGDHLVAVRTLDSVRGGTARKPTGIRAYVDQLTRAEVLLEKGLHHAAAERASAVADRCQVSGQVLIAQQALHLCARARPSSLVAARLGDLGTVVDFELARLHHRHALASAERDPARLADVAVAYDRLGLRRLAGETAATALALADAPRTAPWAATSRRLLHRIRMDGPVAVPAWWWHEDTRSFDLTEREREIAELAATGSSSPQIAERLHLSRRTVENHLQHAYRKLGIMGRDQLGSALGRTMRPPTLDGQSLGTETGGQA